MPPQIAGPAAAALASLSPSQIAFLKGLPKAELHAHLNGSIPLEALRSLALEYDSPLLAQLQNGVELKEIHDFFSLFPGIYAITSTPIALAKATRAVLVEFLEDDEGAAYLELRSTPRETKAMSRMVYVQTVLDEVEKYPVERAALVVSLDRRMDNDVMRECIDIAIKLKREGRRVVGVDLCGDPLARDVQEFEEHFQRARNAGLGITLHIAETKDNSDAETLKLLSYKPRRLGHATFLSDTAKMIVMKEDICLELCLSSNLICKTVPSLEDHHIQWCLEQNHHIAICTDDILPFRNSLLGEYALLLAAKPLGLGLEQQTVQKIAKMGLESRFV